MKRRMPTSPVVTGLLDKRNRALDERFAMYEKEFEGREVPRPSFWSGFRVAPERIEFWKGKSNRLHERHLYTRDGNGWKIETLYP